MEDVEGCHSPDQLPHRRKKLKSKREEFHSVLNTNLPDQVLQGSKKATHHVRNQSTVLPNLQRSGVNIFVASQGMIVRMATCMNSRKANSMH